MSGSEGHSSGGGKQCGFTLADVWCMSNTALAVQTPGANSQLTV